MFRIKELRIKKNISMRQAAKDLGIPYTTYISYEKETHEPNSELLIKMADYFALFSYYEGYGMVLEEAKILNKAILITDTAAREAVNNYEMANIFPNTEDGLYEKLKTVTNKPEMKNNIEYKNEQNIEQIIELLEE